MRSVGDWQVYELLRVKGRCLTLSWFLCGQIMLFKCPNVIYSIQDIPFHSFIRNYHRDPSTACHCPRLLLVWWHKGPTMGTDEICGMFQVDVHGCSVDLLNCEGQVGSGKGRRWELRRSSWCFVAGFWINSEGRVDNLINVWASNVFYGVWSRVVLSKRPMLLPQDGG